MAPQPCAQSGSRCDRGAAAVELALVLPVFLILIFGLIQYGWYFYQVQETAYGAREGARVGAVRTADAGGIGTIVQDKIASASGEIVTVCWTDQTPDPLSTTLSVGDQVSVRVEVAATDFNFPFVPTPPTKIIETAEIRVENDSGPSYVKCGS